MEILYQTEATATGGHEGTVATSDGRLEVELALPAELGGSGQAGTNPEQLFTAGFAACFLSALKVVAPHEQVELPGNASVTARVGLGRRDGGKGYGFAVHLEVSLPGVEREAAEALLARAIEVCPYTHAVRGNVDVAVHIV